MSAMDDRGTPAAIDAGAAGEGGTADEQAPAGPGRGEEVLDTAAAEAGSPSRGEGLSDEELTAQAADPEHGR